MTARATLSTAITARRFPNRWPARVGGALLAGAAMLMLGGCNLQQMMYADQQPQGTALSTIAAGPIASSSTNSAPAPSTPAANSGAASQPTSGSTAPTPTTVVVSWNPDAGAVQGYDLYYGSTADTTNTKFATYAVGSGQLDATAPSVQLDAVNQLGLRSGEQICFSVRAYNQYGTSGYSAPVCTTYS